MLHEFPPDKKKKYLIYLFYTDCHTEFIPQPNQVFFFSFFSFIFSPFSSEGMNGEWFFKAGATFRMWKSSHGLDLLIVSHKGPLKSQVAERF